MTINTPKPMLPVAGVPFTEHQIAPGPGGGHHPHRVRHLVPCGKSSVTTSAMVSSSGWNWTTAWRTSRWALAGLFATPPTPFTCGPDDPVVVFSRGRPDRPGYRGAGGAWREADADVAIYLTRVEDPRAFGLVPTVGDRVTAFLEKPQTPEEIVTDQINAGCYIFRRSVIDQIPADRPVSVERETFPGLLEAGRTVVGWGIPATGWISGLRWPLLVEVPTSCSEGPFPGLAG